MNLGKEILFCFNRCFVLMYLSAYATPSLESSQIDSCSRMRDMGYSIMAVCYTFAGINVVLISFYIYLLAKHQQASFEVQLLIKLDFQDVFMFFMLSINVVALNFMYDPHCGEYAHRMLNLLTLYWIVIFLSAIFGYFIYKKVFIRIEQQIMQQELQQGQQGTNSNNYNNLNNNGNSQNSNSNRNQQNNSNNNYPRGDLEMALLGI